jgi:hypothetical protein
MKGGENRRDDLKPVYIPRNNHPKDFLIPDSPRGAETRAQDFTYSLKLPSLVQGSWQVWLATKEAEL